MSRDRFSLILKFLHINDKKGQKQKGEQGYDPLYNIRPLLTSLISNFQTSYNSGHDLYIDKTIVSFKGRIWFLQYMPKRSNKQGLKAFSLADSKKVILTIGLCMQVGTYQVILG